MISQSAEVPLHKAERPLMSPKTPEPEITDKVFFEIEVDGNSAGRIVLGLFGKVAPKTVQNFKSLCACDKGRGKLSGKDLCYKNTPIHRIIPNFLIQGGDFTHHNGVGGECIWGGKFEDETFELLHNKRYLLAMSNHGPNTNGSQFFINTVKTTWLDGKNVVFGMVVEGKDVVDALEHLGTNSGMTRKTVMIVDSGVL